jgi:hypothetical protein
MTNHFLKSDTVKAICAKHGVVLEELQHAIGAGRKHTLDAHEARAKEMIRRYEEKLKWVRESRAYHELVETLLGLGCSLSEIARTVGRDHTTIMHYRRVLEARERRAAA